MSEMTLAQELSTMRRHYHRFPEPAWMEYQTSISIISHLKALGYEVKYGKSIHNPDCMMGQPKKDLAQAYAATINQEVDFDIQDILAGYTGAVCELDTKRPGPSIAMRFDIDGLAIKESKSKNHLPNRYGFASKRKGYMHACGHDGHITVGLYLAKWLKDHQDQLTGKYLLIFQPAEEGVKGGKSMVNTGLVDGYDYFLSGHIGMGAPADSVTIGTDGFLATTKTDIQFSGLSAHAGASPEKGHNAILAAASALLNLETLPQYSTGAARVNVGKIQGGAGRNIIANACRLEMETRGSSSAINDHLNKRVKEVVAGAAMQYQCKYQLQQVGEAPALNHRDQAFYQELHEVLNQADVNNSIGFHFGASEDVVFFMNRVAELGGKACFFLFGSQLAKVNGHHNSQFDFEESVLVTMVETYTHLLMHFGQQEKEESHG
ncbi:MULTISPECIES: amidohydrolase [Aerococcus]|uniref:amidohydrolase n=1 Tax=Aerococcus TaxID=1375 RepID=UPI000DCC1E90|nr:MULTISPECIES: amidohydrolase [Aerococcus]KAA9298039.1 amidohydrolase [Aerococcus tenax]MDK6689077.1 amidohydrolase [Aerococcus urinae]MDK8133327.1 amidohydrolase [Aerococcus urinae]MDK8484842.1 amidohydrolase [Aerococcus urinae]MDL5177697.1 amidohydrolase [Aerococcus tenax]